MQLANAKRLLDQGRLRELLEIPEGAHGVQLEKLCKAARVKYHPDKGGCPELASLIGAAVDRLLEEERPLEFVRHSEFEFTFWFTPPAATCTKEEGTCKSPNQSRKAPAEEDNKSCFPKIPLWLGARCPELQLLQVEYQKACDRRRKRVSRGDQNIDELSESIAKLLQEAWELTSRPGAYDPRCFPPRGLWIGRVEELQHLWKDYRNAASKLSMRRSRAQPTKDVDEQMEKIRRSAWMILNE